MVVWQGRQARGKSDKISIEVLQIDRDNQTEQSKTEVARAIA